MADPAKYTFLSWLREGAAAAIAAPDTGAATLPSRVEVDVSPSLDGSPLSPAVKVRMLGPGDVTGFDAKQVIRTDPVQLSADFQPHCLPFVEFDRPDFPWLFSPFAPFTAQKNRLRPWLCLITVRKRDGVTIRAEAGVPLPVLSITSDADLELPDLSECWAWAHVQIARELKRTAVGALGDADLATVASAIADPERSCSRLISPRKLEENKAYIACVVPTFEVGRKAGLGETILDADTLAPAWTTSGKTVKLPVHYHWEFSTGAGGSFEALVRRLQPREVPEDVGQRDMDISMAGGGLPEAAPGTAHVILGLESALRPPEGGPSTWNATHATLFQDALVKRLNAPATLTTSAPAIELLAPPIYGRWHALKDRVPTATGKPKWLRDLNVDPRNRVAAAVGTLIVQDQQEQLMAAAWEQVGDILRANQLLMEGQLAVAVSSVLHEKHLSAFPAEVLLQVVAPTLGRIVIAGGDGTTAHDQIKRTCLPTVALSGAFRRVFRATGPISRRFRRGAANRGISPDSVVARLASGTLAAAPWTPGGMAAIDEQTRATILGANAATAPGDFGVAFARHKSQWNTIREGVGRRECQPLPGTLGGNVLKALDPTETIPLRVRARIDIPAAMTDPEDPVRPAMAAPEFPAPMYVPLRNLSQDWIFTGLAKVTANTVTLLETNPRFIEAYMVGLNHEMGRELLWRGFPTDQRGSCFRQFWDVRSRVPAPDTPAERDAAKDIKPIHAWTSTALGTHVQQGADEGQLVLLVRGDLLRRYPRATISAVPAKWTIVNGAPDKPRVLNRARTPLFPIFGGSLEPDLVLLGFDLTTDEARGSSTPADNDPGYFFVFQEQPTEPRFAIGEEGTGKIAPAPRPWSDLDWSMVETNSAGYIDIAGTGQRSELTKFSTTDASWGSHAADLAFITLRRPFRLAIHADDMLPPGP